jgi:hypothetical protein
MAALSREHIAALRAQLDRGVPSNIAVPSAVGGTQTAEGLWRLYSGSWPGKGIDWWNSESPWRVHWQRFLPQSLFSIAEDIFGNQLIVIPGRDAVYLLNHETSECHSLYVCPFELLSSVLETGIDWIDFYTDGSLQVARDFGPIPDDSHLHWTTPLTLGGPVTRANISLVPRDQHHAGHAKLWAQMSSLPPGTGGRPRHG